MLPRLTPEVQRQLEKAIDSGQPVPHELALALWRELIAVRALATRWSSLLASSSNPRLRAAARGLSSALEPGGDIDDIALGGGWGTDG